MYYLGETINFEKKEIKVKQYFRKGKIVRASKRKINKKKKIIKKTLLITGGLIGLSAGSYLGLRARYIHNLNKFAKNLKANPELGETLSQNIKNINFTMSGFVGVGRTEELSNNIAKNLKNSLDPKLITQNEFIPINHVFTPNLKYAKQDKGVNKAVEFFSKSFKALGQNFVKGYNEEAFNIAEVLYSYAVKNPGKKINIIGHSGGALLADEVSYILNKKGINTKLLTMASPDFLKLPSKNKLDLMTKNDFVKPFSNKNTIIVTPYPGENSHRQPAYFKNKETMDKIQSFLYS